MVIRLSGEGGETEEKAVEDTHLLSKDEAKFVFESGCEQLILGSGQVGNVHLSPEAETYFEKRAARFCCSPPLRRLVRSTGRMQRRSGFFT